MAIAQVDAREDIITQLETIPGVDVYRGQYLTDGAVPQMTEDGLFPPYITIVFGASYAGYSRGIVSERLNTLRTTVTVYVVSPSDSITLDFIDQVNDKMLGFVPTDGTELKAYGGYDYVDADLGVNRYVHSLVFTYQTNMSTP
jgi:hypothetical protein